MPDAPERASDEARGGALPDVIHLPDQSQPEPPPAKPRGRHFGPRRVADPKDRVISFRCTEEEHRLFTERAAAKGLEIGPYLRLRETGSPGPRVRRKRGPEVAVLRQLLGQIGRTGSNLNQIAHRLNEYDFEGIPALRAMRDEHQAVLAEHRAVLQAILKALEV
ncbi:MAG: plasmid mobilization relaxosome protein MobC [Bradyrhizobium sp.]|uniref:plasmid mobilization protein n=1 Tax=Bradyrhizobium sp. TaxID=376 RepID=UPI003D0F7E28